MKIPAKTTKTFVEIFDRIVWSIGMFTILKYGQEHWPTIYKVATCVFIIGISIWYTWKYLVQPFREGLH